MTAQHRTFRLDINGLRAWAVVAVILYHFGIPGFEGGFVGVDIFFVISGFLMTGIIVKGIESPGGRTFSLLQFYLARAVRIIPALLVLCIFLMAIGWLFLPATEYFQLSQHVASAVSFVSNMVFWREAGYFDTSSHDKWLLHTWSLSVEWQFYILLPLVVLLINKVRSGRPTIIVMFSLGFVLSLALSAYLTPIKASASFFLLPTRAWEMLAGGLVFLLAGSIRLPDRVLKGCDVLGFVLILISIYMFNGQMHWPSYNAVLPVLATVLVLIASQNQSLFTKSGVAQWLGTRSYSLYLWHWPIVVALAYFELQSDSLAVISGLALTLVLGHLSYISVENTVRVRFKSLPPLRGLMSFSLAVFAFVIICSLILQDRGVPGRIPANIDAVFNESLNKNPRIEECHVSRGTPVPECHYGGDKLGVIVIGDSHSESIMRSVEKALPDESLNVLDWSLSACITAKGIKSTNNGPYCGQFVSYALEKQQSLPAEVPMIIMNRASANIIGGSDPVPVNFFDKPFLTRSPMFFEQMAAGIIDTACEFAKTRPVYMVRPTPEFAVNVPKAMGRALLRGEELRASLSLTDYHKRHDFVWNIQDEAQRRCGIKILDPLPYLCEGNTCYGDKDGLPLYYDDNHLNERGASLLSPLFSQVVNSGRF